MVMASLACRCRPGLIGARPILPKRTAGSPCVFFCVGLPAGGYRIGTSTASRRYSAGNCLPSAASFGAS